MKLMLSIHLPLLPLEALRPLWCEPGAFAVADHGTVIAISKEAEHAGVRLGMRIGGVEAVSPDTLILERSIEQEERAMDAVATALMQFTPQVARREDFCVVLDVGASLTLFKGPHVLCNRVARTVRALGLTGRVGAAPTAQGAWLLSRSCRLRNRTYRRRMLSHKSMVGRLNALPCDLLPEAAPFQEWLSDIGAKQVGALRRLPRTGLLRRTSKDLLTALDHAFGEAPEMFEWIKPPLIFKARIETFDHIEHAEALLDGATTLLLQLVGWLTALRRAIRTLTFNLEHERGRDAIAPTVLELAVAEPTWHETHLVRLLKERLSRLELCAPVIAVSLEAVKVEEMAPLNDSLFPEPGGSPQEFHRLLELLIARLGPDSVLVPAPVEDYRPELCNTWRPATAKPQKTQLSQVFEGRPFFLLPKPIQLLTRGDRPFYMSPLRIVSGPERIEAGWWNDQTAARDYYIAQGSDAACYWIYLERTRDAKWFLHGLYA